MTQRPNWENDIDACCACGIHEPTPAEHETPGTGELHVWQPNPTDPPQWICSSCKERLERNARGQA